MSYRGNIDGHLLHRWQRSRIHRIDVFRSSDSGADPSAPKVARTCALQRFFVARNRSSRFRTSAHGARPTVSGLIGNRALPHGNAPLAPLARSPTAATTTPGGAQSQFGWAVTVQFIMSHGRHSASADSPAADGGADGNDAIRRFPLDPFIQASCSSPRMLYRQPRQPWHRSVHIRPKSLGRPAEDEIVPERIARHQHSRLLPRSREHQWQ